MKRNIISNLILVLAIVVFLFSGYKLYSIYSEYRKGEKEYEEVAKEVVEVIEVEEEPVDEQEETSVETHEELEIDFEKLHQINPDVVAWLDFDEPSKISYPVLHGEDNNEYLRTTIEHKKNTAGSLFVDASNQGDFSDKNTFIYGHNMRNGSMFGQLKKYKEKAFCEENPYFYIYTPDGGKTTYRIFAVCIVEDTSETYIKHYATEEEFADYIQYIRGISRYNVDVEVTSQSQIVSLSTCTNVTKTQRLVVHGVKLEETVAGE